MNDYDSVDDIAALLAVQEDLEDELSVVKLRIQKLQMESSIEEV